MGLAEPSRARPAAAPRARSVCALFRARVREGGDEEAEALLGDLAHHVRNDEPGCDAYVLTRAMGSPVHFVMHARFADWRSFEAHADTEHMRKLMPRISALLDAPLEIELYLET